MSQSNSLKFNNPGLFVPSVVRGVIDSGTPTGFLNFNQVADRNVGTTSSFRYDPPGFGIRSTQQIEVDYSKFENHTFFQSAIVGTNLALKKIIDEFPFDGTRKEIEEFLDGLTGYEKYVYDQFPKNIGYLFFSGSSGTPGTYIEVPDFAGSEFPTISTKQTGESVLNPGLNSFAWEMQLFLANDSTNGNQVVCQKLSGTYQGISLFVSESAASSASLVFSAVSGSAHLNASTFLNKGRFNHVVATFNRRPGVNQLEIYVDEELVASSSNFTEFGEIDFNVSSFVIGSGSTMGQGTNSDFVPAETLSGALDEFRFFHNIRTIEQQKTYAKKSIFQNDDLVLYYKFNEPSGTFASTNEPENDRILLDYSGNALHTLINGFDLSLRVTSSIANPMTYEKLIFSPALFPNNKDVVSLSSDLFASASTYDASNPNLITKLIPRHYFLEGQVEEALEKEDGTIIDPFTGETLPGTSDAGQPQIIQSVLFIWAKFFDELKIVLDSFGKTLHVSYDGRNAVPDAVLPKVAEYFGLTLPSLFSGASIEQFVDAENLEKNITTSEESLKSVQNQIWRRILVNARDIIQSKGTLHSVKSFIRALGIDPDGNFRIREFGGPTKRNLSNQHENRTEVSTMLDMSGSTALIQTNLLSGSRTEIGFPLINGTFVNVNDNLPHGISNDSSDGYWTSGSFTYEGIYRFPIGRESLSKQSLARIHVLTGALGMFNNGASGVSINMVAVSGTTPQVKLYARPGMNLDLSSPFLTMSINANIFDGKQWSVSFGRFRADDPIDYLEPYPNLTKSTISSSYFLRAARAERGTIVEQYVTQSFFEEALVAVNNSLSNDLASANPSGSILVIGSQSLNVGTTSQYRFLHATDEVTDDDARETNFNGLVGHMRFWSKGLLEDEWREHVRNFKSLGVQDPLLNFNFQTELTGAWNRLRIDTNTDQLVTESNGSGEISIFDFSQNDSPWSGTGFEANKQVIKPETFYYGHISPKFDETSTTNKVRARGFLDFDLAKERGAKFGIVNEIDPNEIPQDDTRFTIDFSIIDSLDQDIINIFSTLDELDNILGDPELIYAPDYPGLENLRDIYFNRLTDKVKLKSFFEFFKWFDRNIGNFIASLLPRKTKFRGVNFVIESHMLERPKFENLNVDQYLNAGTERSSLKGTILLQQIVGTIKKY
jgi:hypothetical protein